MESASHCNKSLLKTIYSPAYSGTGSEINCPELNQSWKVIESPRQWVTFYFTKEEVKELYPDCKIWTASTTPVSSVPIWKIIPKASASEKEPSQNTVIVKSAGKNLRTPSEIYEQVKHLGYREEPTKALISTCKTSSSDIQKCILFGLIIMYNESGNKQNSNACINKNNCLWVKSWKISYSSLDEWMENWVQIFNRYWYKAESPSFFYSEKWKLSKSRYCVSESSSNTEIGCPNWLSIANKKYEQLYPIIYLN